jgi:hypothetical protein
VVEVSETCVIRCRYSQRAKREKQSSWQGDRYAAEQLLPLVDEELLQLAATKLAHEKPDQTP